MSAQPLLFTLRTEIFLWFSFFIRCFFTTNLGYHLREIEKTVVTLSATKRTSRDDPKKLKNMEFLGRFVICNHAFSEHVITFLHHKTQFFLFPTFFFFFFFLKGIILLGCGDCDYCKLLSVILQMGYFSSSSFSQPLAALPL